MKKETISDGLAAAGCTSLAVGIGVVLGIGAALICAGVLLIAAAYLTAQ